MGQGARGRVTLGTADSSGNVGPGVQKAGDQLVSIGLRRDQEEVAVSGVGPMEARCGDGLPDGDRGQVAGVVTTAESSCLSLQGTIGALSPVGSWV